MGPGSSYKWGCIRISRLWLQLPIYKAIYRVITPLITGRGPLCGNRSIAVPTSGQLHTNDQMNQFVAGEKCEDCRIKSLKKLSSDGKGGSSRGLTKHLDFKQKSVRMTLKQNEPSSLS